MKQKEDENETELESLLIAASNEFESSALPPGAPAQDNAISHSHSHFGPPTSEEVIRLAREARIPQKTRQDTNFCVNVWKAWKTEREKNKTNYSTTEPTEQHTNKPLAKLFHTRGPQAKWPPLPTKYPSPHFVWPSRASSRTGEANRLFQWHRVCSLASHAGWRDETAPVIGGWLFKKTG